LRKNSRKLSRHKAKSNCGEEPPNVSQQLTTGISTALQNTTTTVTTFMTTENVPVTTTLQTDSTVTELPFSAEVEAALRLVWERPEGELTASLLEKVTKLTVTFEIDAVEQSLKGLELCPALRVLVINNYCGDSLEFLRNVLSLEVLSLDWLDSMTPEIVYDLTPLAALTNLTGLSLGHYTAHGVANFVTDLSPLTEQSWNTYIWYM